MAESYVGDKEFGGTVKPSYKWMLEELRALNDLGQGQLFHEKWDNVLKVAKGEEPEKWKLPEGYRLERKSQPEGKEAYHGSWTLENY